MPQTQSEIARNFFRGMDCPTDLGNVGRGRGSRPSPLKPLVRDERVLDQRRAQSQAISDLVSEFSAKQKEHERDRGDIQNG